MKKFTFSFKSLLLAAGLLLGSANAWGYTKTLTDGLEVAGYKAKAFYNFQNNTPAVLPTSGDLRYRDGGGYGLHNFGSGGRSATATIPVASTDILVIQEYNSSYVTTINRGTENATLSTSTGYRVFDITSTADDVTFSVPRYGGIVAAFVMEKDNTVKTGNYTINYKASSVTVKTVSGTDVAVGTEIPVLSNFIEGGKKYVTDGGQASSLTIAEGDNNLDITVTEAAQYTCTVNAKTGETTLASPNLTVYSGENAKVFYKKAYKNGGIWYMTPANGSYPSYAHNFSAVSANSNYDVTTYAANENIVYFGEVEEMNLSGSFAADGGQPDRYSNGVAKRLYSKGGGTPSGGSWVYTDDIPAGVYTVTMWARNQSGTQTATLPVYLRDSEGNMTDLSTSFEAWAASAQGEKSVEIAIPNDGKTYSVAIYNYSGYNSNLEMDYVYVTFVRPLSVPVTVSAAGYATFSSEYALDFSKATSGLEAYMITGHVGNAITKTQVTGTVPAGTGLLLKGAAGDYNIPIVGSSSTNVSANLMKAGTGASVSAEGGKTKYVLGVNNNGTTGDTSDDFAEFQKIVDTPATVPTGKAYLQFDEVISVKSLSFIDDGKATGVDAPVVAEAEEDGVYYNTAGQQVTKDYKGIVIKNGKKYFNK